MIRGNYTTFYYPIYISPGRINQEDQEGQGMWQVRGEDKCVQRHENAAWRMILK
jgi:hypothetical protein